MNTSPQLYCSESHSKLGFDFFCFEFISVSLKSYKHLCYVFNFFAVSLLKRHREYSSHHLTVFAELGLQLRGDWKYFD